MGRDGPNLLRIVSLGLLLSAVALFFYQLISYSRHRALLPEGLTIGGVPVGGLNQAAALERLLQTYGTPVELQYGDQRILLTPAQVGFQLDSEAMMAGGELARTSTDFWSGFWDYLWNRPGQSQSVGLRAELSQSQLASALQDIAARYDQPAIPSRPVPGGAQFEPGVPGRTLDVERAAGLVSEVFMAPGDRSVSLPVVESRPVRPGMDVLETLLKQNLEVDDFNGLAVFYIQDLRTGEELHFGVYRDQEISVEPDIAFDAASTIKIAIATAFYRYFDDPLTAEQSDWLSQMITLSGNDPANWLMEDMDFLRGPMMVTETMEELGLGSALATGEQSQGSTFIVAWFENPQRFTSESQLVVASTPRTPANQRPDINTHPNPYNQTTVSELGMLLADLYNCQRGGGALLAAFPDQIKPEECGRILDLLAQNRIAWLIEASVPEGTRVAHKHGWTSSPLDFISDAGIVYSPGGDYVLAMSLWDSNEMVWEPTAGMFAQLGRAVYNYFNP